MSTSPRLFVYGTLLPGQRRWDLLRPLTAAVEPQHADAPGRLYRTPYGWPAAAFDPSAVAVVPGLAVALRNLGHAFPVLDAIEGTETGLVERHLIQTSASPCWDHWPGNTDTLASMFTFLHLCRRSRSWENCESQASAGMRAASAWMGA